MKKRKILSILLVGLTVIAVYLFSDISVLESSSTDNGVKGNSEWNIEFFDDFDSFGLIYEKKYVAHTIRTTYD